MAYDMPPLRNPPFEMMYEHQMTFLMELRTELLGHEQQIKEQNPYAFPNEEDDDGLQPEVQILPDPPRRHSKPICSRFRG